MAIVARKSKRRLDQDWNAVGDDDLSNLDIAAGTIVVANEDTGRSTLYTLDAVYIQLLKHAYKRGRDGRMPW